MSLKTQKRWLGSEQPLSGEQHEARGWRMVCFSVERVHTPRLFCCFPQVPGHTSSRAIFASTICAPEYADHATDDAPAAANDATADDASTRNATATDVATTGSARNANAGNAARDASARDATASDTAPGRPTAGHATAGYAAASYAAADHACHAAAAAARGWVWWRARRDM